MTRFLQPRYALPITSVLLALFLLFGVGSHVIALKTGKEISITARGYDPRALLLGHYVRLQPDLSGTLSTEASARVSEAFDMSDQGYRHETAWLSLTRSEDGWTIEDVSKDRPAGEMSADTALLYTPLSLSRDRAGEGNLGVEAHLDIDRFYASEAEAKDLEDKLRDGADVKLLLSIADNGQARLKGVSVDGVRTEISWW